MSLCFTLRLHQQTKHSFWNPSTMLYRLSYLLRTADSARQPNQQIATELRHKFICMLQVMPTALLRESPSRLSTEDTIFQSKGPPTTLTTPSQATHFPLLPIICHPFPFHHPWACSCKLVHTSTPQKPFAFTHSNQITKWRKGRSWPAGLLRFSRVLSQQRNNVQLQFTVHSTNHVTSRSNKTNIWQPTLL